MYNKKYLLKRNFFFLIILIFYIFLNPLAAFENEKVHREINKNAVNLSILDPYLENYLKNVLGFSDALEEEFNSKKTLEWLQDGGTEEDDPESRCLRHFHDPLKNWSQAGLFTTNLSTIYWSQVPEPQDEFDLTNEFSWPIARSYFYKALTVSEKNEREGNWAKTFKSLGQVMHLLSDMAVPAHVRNDMHPEVKLKNFFKISHFEIYTEGVYDKFDIMKYDQAIKPDPTIFALAKYDANAQSPISALFDTDKYDGLNPTVTRDGQPIGLTEYTNANFLSESTIFKSYPYPDLSETDWDEFYLAPEIILSEDLNEEKKLYLYKMFGSVKKIAALSYFYTHVPKTGPVATRAIIMDDEVYKTYAGELVPKAVGYSSSILDYFFRGTIEARNVALIKNTSGQVTGLNLEIKNSSMLGENPEPFVEGTIELVSRYTISGDPDTPYTEIKDIHTIATESDAINTDYISVTADFSNPIPPGAMDLSFTLVFKGTLGNEPDAVAARVLKPTSKIAYANNEPDVFGTQSHIYTISPDGTGEIQITGPDTDFSYVWFASPAWSPDGLSLAFLKETCINPDHFVDMECDHASHNWTIEILNQSETIPYPGNVVKTLALSDPNIYEGSYPLAFSFSPDGNKITGISALPPIYSLVIGDLSTQAFDYINTAEYWMNKNPWGYAPEWSPDGSAIVYVDLFDPSNDQTSPSDIRLISPDGSQDNLIISGGFRNIYPSWSPDGEWIAFSSDNDGSAYLDIRIMDKNGAVNSEIIVDEEINNLSPSFSPDGRMITFAQGGQVYTIPVSGGSKTPVTNSIGQKNATVWSPYIFEDIEP